MSNTVAIVKCGNRLEEAVAKVIELAGAAHLIRPGARVLVKPNWHGGKGTTSTAAICAVCRYLKGRGAEEVVVGDGPYYGLEGERLEKYMNETAERRVIEAVGARVVVFNHHRFRIFEHPHPDLPPRVGITHFVYDCDVVINMPIMKTHLATLVTLGMKNLKGCLRQEDKRAFHQMNLHRALVALNRLVTPHINLMDVTVGYEGLGPGQATPVRMDLLLCSRNVVALDSVACRLMGLEPLQVKLIAMAAKAGVGEADPEKIRVVGEPVERHRRRFELPYETAARRFPGLRLIHEGACSGCMGNFFKALFANKNGKSEPFPAVVIGRGEPPARGCLLIGKCTRRYREGNVFLDGCPPDAETIGAYLKDKKWD